MGCCASSKSLPVDSTELKQVVSYEKKKSAERRTKLAQKPGSHSHSDHSANRRSSDQNSSTAKDESCSDDDPFSHGLEHQKSINSIRNEERRQEIMKQKEALAQKQQDAFDRQVISMNSLTQYQRLYDIWEEYANSDGLSMDIDGLTKALAVFGMIIDTDKEFQRHIFRKFDVDNEKEITYNDFSATIASLVGSNTCDDALHTLFEIFDLDQDGYLCIEDMARILLAQNQITVTVTGADETEKRVVYTKKQCLKQARKMVAEYDSAEFQDNKISFDEFHAMMRSRTDQDMIIDHMQAPSVSINGNQQLVDIM